MFGIGIGVQEADRDRLDASFASTAQAAFDARHVELLAHLARSQEPLVDLDGQMARHQRAGPVKEQVVGFRPVAAADDIDVARAAGDDQADFRALALDQRVDRVVEPWIR